jgi:hypothetical protein
MYGYLRPPKFKRYRAYLATQVIYYIKKKIGAILPRFLRPQWHLGTGPQPPTPTCSTAGPS